MGRERRRSSGETERSHERRGRRTERPFLGPNGTTGFLLRRSVPPLPGSPIDERAERGEDDGLPGPLLPWWHDGDRTSLGVGRTRPTRWNFRRCPASCAMSCSSGCPREDPRSFRHGGAAPDVTSGRAIDEQIGFISAENEARQLGLIGSGLLVDEGAARERPPVPARPARARRVVLAGRNARRRARRSAARDVRVPIDGSSRRIAIVRCRSTSAARPADPGDARLRRRRSRALEPTRATRSWTSAAVIGLRRRWSRIASARGPHSTTDPALSATGARCPAGGRGHRRRDARSDALARRRRRSSARPWPGARGELDRRASAPGGRLCHAVRRRALGHPSRPRTAPYAPCVSRSPRRPGSVRARLRTGERATARGRREPLRRARELKPTNGALPRAGAGTPARERRSVDGGLCAAAMTLPAVAPVIPGTPAKTCAYYTRPQEAERADAACHASAGATVATRAAASSPGHGGRPGHALTEGESSSSAAARGALRDGLRPRLRDRPCAFVVHGASRSSWSAGRAHRPADRDPRSPARAREGDGLSVRARPARARPRPGL